jgi:hypothetical protein
MIKLNCDFYEAAIFFSEDIEGETVTVIDKDTGELYCYFKDDGTEEAVMKGMERKIELLKNIEENPESYLVLEEFGDTEEEQIEIMKKYDLIPKGGYPESEEI